MDLSEVALLEARVKTLETKVMQLQAQLTALKAELTKDEKMAEDFEKNPLGSML